MLKPRQGTDNFRLGETAADPVFSNLEPKQNPKQTPKPKCPNSASFNKLRR
jgi:hypothetical protein